ncbi:hypothetical protein BDY21DRAFT_360901 [Lineolata rhizophorae]|uniref:Uncharacterized protein n=1 Tax=Lineolata rhizophorae TaxID=578093 RepID=A0A6A6PA34_9PEZI|nr:hypothetical protein BDY21DRAFT_360901 [Lineolata rhizophorae]
MARNVVQSIPTAAGVPADPRGPAAPRELKFFSRPRGLGKTTRADSLASAPIKMGCGWSSCRRPSWRWPSWRRCWSPCRSASSSSMSSGSSHFSWGDDCCLPPIRRASRPVVQVPGLETIREETESDEAVPRLVSNGSTAPPAPAEAVEAAETETAGAEAGSDSGSVPSSERRKASRRLGKLKKKLRIF